MKRAFLVLAGLLCLHQPLSAQTLFGSGLFEQPAINSPWALLDSQQRFSFSTAFGSMRSSPEYLPEFNPSEPLSAAYLSPENKNSVERIYEMHKASDIHIGGEIGFLYGTSSGSGFGREDKAGYIIGTVGNEKFSITAGYYRQETSYSGGRFRR